MSIKSFYCALALLLLASCSSTKTNNKQIVIEAPDRLPSPMVQLGGDTFDAMVEKWIHFFTQEDRERFQTFLNRGEKYRSVVQEVLEQNEIPPEFYYLAMIESGYVTYAKSRARAVGAWQFIKSTGKRYDLDINYYVDERKDPIRSTEAAAKYLRDLFTAFQSWDLAMAAYNAGEYRVLTAIIKGKTRNFDELCDKKLLPRETRNYVPKFIAAATIGEDPEKYGFKIDSQEEYPDVIAMELPSPVRLKDLAAKTNIPLNLLKQANPHIRRGVTPPYSDTYEVWLPESEGQKIKTLLPVIASLKVKGMKKRHYAGRRYYHRVRRGENLSVIARKYRMSVAYLKRLNGLRGSRIHPGKRLRISSKGYHKSRGRRVAMDDSHHHYRVRRGDTLSSIARRNRTSIRRLMRLNRLRSSRIYPGMKLRIASKPSASKQI